MFDLERLNEPAIETQPERVQRMFGLIARRYDLANHLLSCGADFYWRNRAAQITGFDFSEEMLAVAHRKGLRKTIVADAMRLPFADSSFDCATVAFGLRNMEDWGAARREISRFLNVNGHLLVLEFSLPRLSILRTVYRFYLHRCLPLLGSFLTQQKRAYHYLGGSIEEFPSDGAMVRLIEASGFANATAEPLTGGIATIYIATRKKAL